jgi:hypothetical protein
MGDGKPLDRAAGGVDNRDSVIVLQSIPATRWSGGSGGSRSDDRTSVIGNGVSSRDVPGLAVEVLTGVGSWSSFAH